MNVTEMECLQMSTPLHTLICWSKLKKFLNNPCLLICWKTSRKTVQSVFCLEIHLSFV